MKPNHPRQYSIGRDAAIALAKSNWWEGKPARELVEFQLFTVELSMPFSVFHEALEAALGRFVWAHELAWIDSIMDEFLGLRPAPTMLDILELVPKNKRVLLVVDAKEAR